MKKKLFLIYFVFYFLNVYSQYAPAAGLPGSTAIHKDSSIIKYWAENAEIYRGYLNIKDKQLGKVDYGEAGDALGKADNKVVSLGDSGVAVIYFENPVFNGDSWDFAVFENAFNDDFLELAFVEVSSDGQHYFRFPAVSLTDTSQQTGTFSTLKAENIYNLAGKYRVDYGVPFDLDSLPDNELLDKNRIKYIKIIDVIGCIDSDIASRDYFGNIINDPFPTAFNTGGFDLDAVAVMHMDESQDVSDAVNNTEINIFPVPAKDYVYLEGELKEYKYILVFNSLSFPLLKKIAINQRSKIRINTSDLPSGKYTIVFISQEPGKNQIKQIVIVR